MLGPLRVEAPGQEVRIGGVRRRAVLLRLLAAPGRLVPAGALAEDVWDGDPPAAAASTLQSHVSALRQAIGPGRLTFADGGYRLRVEPGELDSLLFEAEVATGQAAAAAGDFTAAAAALDRALGRWRGQAFADVLESGWAVLAARHLEEIRNVAVEEALEARLALGAHDEVCGLAAEAVAAEPLRERRWAALMLALYRAGRQAEALEAYQRLRGTLADQLGLDPSPRLSRLQDDILAQSPALDWTGDMGRMTVVPPAAAAAPAARTNLPAPVASFVGRHNELAELGKLARRHRLVTITGTGGAGKTRLAIEVAASMLDGHRDGVWFVDLSELTEPAGVPGAVAAAIGLRQVPGRPVGQSLAERVTGMRALLIVDNCEHLVGSAAATIQQVLEAGAGVQVIATSRQPLRVPGETVWQTPPVSYPDTPREHDLAGLASFDAVRLFADRAGPIGTAGEPGPDLRVIAAITARLQGLPLAIELAAARAAQLGLRRLAAVLQDRISLSWLGSRTVHARQQTLSATIGWSYDLLTPELRSALKRLAVFTGGFTLEAAEAVTGNTETIADTVAALAERSLIAADCGAGQPGRPEVRYQMLETIRQYCAERAADENTADVLAAARDAHGRYFADLARQGSAALTGWHQGRWLMALEADHANMVAAIGHLLGRPGQATKAVQMIVDLDRFWQHGRLAECASLVQASLEVAGEGLSEAVHCSALNLAGYAAIRHDPRAGYADFSKSLRIAQAAQDNYHAASALRGLAYANRAAGDLDGARTAGNNALDLARTVGDPVLLGECLIASALASDPASRRAIYTEALAVTRRSGDRVFTAIAHNDLGDLAAGDGDLEAARRHFEQAQAIFRELGDPLPDPVINLGWVHLRSGDPAAADTAFTKALHAYEQQHDRLFTSNAIMSLACSAAAQHDWERAACLLGFADAELQRYGSSWSGPEGAYRLQVLADVQRQLGPDFDRCYDSGHAGERNDLIDLALRQLPIP